MLQGSRAFPLNEHLVRQPHYQVLGKRPDLGEAVQQGLPVGPDHGDAAVRLVQDVGDRLRVEAEEDGGATVVGGDVVRRNSSLRRNAYLVSDEDGEQTLILVSAGVVNRSLP